MFDPQEEFPMQPIIMGAFNLSGRDGIKSNLPLEAFYDEAEKFEEKKFSGVKK